MPMLLLELIAGPVLVAAATLAHRAWGPGAGGVLSSFPAVVGPVLLITAGERGAPFTARAATGTLLGLVALAGFVVVYARAAQRACWWASLGAGWACAALLATLVAFGGGRLGVFAAAIIATVSLLAGYRLLPSTATELELPQRAPGDLILRMAITALLIVLLAAAGAVLGPLVGGLLAALPALASVLAVFTHRRHGPLELVVLLRGMLAGMAGFVGFCVVVATLIVPAGAGPTFLVASLTAVSLQFFSLRAPRRRTAMYKRNLANPIALGD